MLSPIAKVLFVFAQTVPCNTIKLEFVCRYVKKAIGFENLNRSIETAGFL